MQDGKSTPLHNAAYNNNTELLSLFINKGGDIDMKDQVS